MAFEIINLLTYLLTYLLTVVDYFCYIYYIKYYGGIARIFSGGALFFLKKVDCLFLVVALKTQAENTKLTAPTIQISPVS